MHETGRNSIKARSKRAGASKCSLARDGAPPRALTAQEFSRALRLHANPERARNLESFFKTGPGEYAEGDRFLGVMMPETRRLVRQFGAMPPLQARRLVRSRFHEERMAGLLLWVRAFERGDPKTRRRIFGLYRRHTRFINNWDLVDLSAPHIVGQWLSPKEPAQLDSWVRSPVVWERRIAVLASFAWIRQGRFAPSLRLCRRLLKDPHDLMHKASGWMLREIGKRNRPVLNAFLGRHAHVMPRTMLRYALEHCSEAARRRHLAARARSQNARRQRA